MKRPSRVPEFKDYAEEIPELLEKMEEISLNSSNRRRPTMAKTPRPFLDMLGTDGEQELESEMAELKKMLDKILDEQSSPSAKRKSLRMYYGINYSKEFTFDEIGRELKLTRERVRQIKNKSLNKLLKNKEARDILSPFLSGGPSD
jgi:RNA polymerase primary sigma factor